MESRAFVESRSWWILWILLASSQAPRADQGSPIQPVPPTAVDSLALPDATLELEWTSCPLFCIGSVYTVTLESDGTVRWNGKKSVGALGKRTTHVPPFEVRYLFDRFRAAEFFRFDARYIVEDDEPQPTEILRLRGGDERKAVECSTIDWRFDSMGNEIGGWQARRELLALGNAIQCVLGLESWIRVDEPIAPRSSDATSEAFGLSADGLSSVRIELESEDRIVVHGDGSVEWNGRALPESTLPADQVRWLLHRFEKARFFDLADPDLGAASSCCPTSIRLRIPGREHAVAFSVPVWRPIAGQHPDAIYRTAIDCTALARTIRVLVRADRLDPR